MEEDLDGLICNIRACLVSSKGPALIRNLSRDFETLNGSAIPFKKFNHPTLESFLKSIPSLRISGSGNSLMVDAAVDNKSLHISNLVSKQKTPKRRESYNWRGGGSTSRGAGRSHGYVPRGGSYRGGYSSAPKTSQYNYQPTTYSHYNSTQPLPMKSSYQNNSVESVTPLFVKIDDNSDKRQVSVGETSKQLSYKESHTQRYEKPPRFQKGAQQTYVSPQLSASQLTKDIEKKLTFEYSNTVNKNPFEKSSSDIISPLTPYKLIEAGLAKQQKQHYFIPDVSENSDVPLVPSPDEIDIKNNINLLLKYVLARRWTNPEYHLLPASGPKSYSKKYFATVKIMTTNDTTGQTVKKYSGYNYEDSNPDIAKGYAAKVALEQLRKEEKVNNNKTNITSDKTLICSRISKIVADSFNGMFAKTVEENYIEMFNERLPDDWIETLNSCPAFSVESTLNSVVILPKDPTLQQQVFHEPFPALVPLVPDLPLGENWSVFITYATSTSEVYFRIIEENYSDRYEELTNDMNFYYKMNGMKELALSIETKQYYAAQTEEDFFRVCVNSINEDEKTVSAWLIDNGDIETFSFSSLYSLPDEFRNLPRQAVQCSLKGLESFSEDNFTSDLLQTSEYLVGKRLIAQISSRPGEDNSSCLKVIFYDTSGADDINVNEKLLDIIYENAVPDLPNEGCAKEVYVSNVSKRGEVYVQIPGPKFEKITEVLETLSNEEISKYKLASFRNVALNKIYLAKYSKDDRWYRAVVIATPSVQNNKIAVRFVDFGNSDTVSINDIAEVDELPSIIRILPHQAVKVALNNLPIESLNNTEIAKLHTLLLDDEKIVLIKMVKLDEDPPIVDIFYKNDADSNAALVSVNCTILWQRDNFRLDGSSSSKTNKNIHGDNDIFSASLKCPKFDEDVEYVVVLLSANPGNFIFQPFRFKKELHTLMSQLQTYYDATALPEVTVEEVTKGGLYAALYTDNLWYRVVVTEVDQKSSKVSVRLCDFGDIMCVPLSNLRDLETEFREKPFMAVKGRLAGVQPIHMDWSVEDCIRFQELVINKALASLVVNIDQNPANPMEMVVSLNLVDKNTKKSISEILITENRAVKET